MGEESAPFGKFVQSPLQFVVRVSLVTHPRSLIVSVDCVHRVPGTDEAGRLPAPPILAGDAASLPHGAVEIRPTISVNHRHDVLRPL